MIWVVLIGLSAYRLWRLIAEDSITEPGREWLLSRSPEKIRELVQCPWCLGSWLAFGVTWAADATIGLDVPVLVGLASAVVVGWLGDQL